MRNKLFIFRAALLLNAAVIADDHETTEIDAELQAVADKVSAAYNGDALAQISGYMIADKYLTMTIGQSHSPALMETAMSAQLLNYDISNNFSN